MKNLYCYDNEIIKWIYGDNLYCLHIQHDDEADNNPRWWDDHDSTMACFHSRYNLGDKIDEKHRKSFGMTWFTSIVLMKKFWMHF